MTTENTPSEFEAAYAAGAASKPLHDVLGDAAPAAVAVRAGHSIVDVEGHMQTPRLKRALVLMHQPQSFIDYVRTYADADSLITADLDKRTLHAILDYHAPREGGQRWGVHKVTYTCRETAEWKAWTGKNGVKLDQRELAEFIEANLPDIASPAGATLLEMVSTLEAKKDVSFLSSVRLHDGSQQFTYNETVDQSSTTRGELRLVDQFLLGLSPFDGTPKYEVLARLRFRITSGKLTFWFELDRPHKVVEAAFNEAVALVKDGLPAVRLVHGAVAKEAK
jgi:uncharacterized protein YfdQ (DUF2303 family)